MVFYWRSLLVLDVAQKISDGTEGYSTLSLSHQSTVIKEHAHNCAVLRSDTTPQPDVPSNSMHVQVEFWDRSLRNKTSQDREEGLCACVMWSVALSLVVRQQLTFSGCLYALAALWHEPNFIVMEKIRFTKPAQAVSNDWWLRRDFILSRLEL